MTTIKTISLNLVLPVGKVKYHVVLFNSIYTGIFSFAGIKKPSLILINKPVSMVALLTKTRNGMQK
jgi:hypothetical protein